MARLARIVAPGCPHHVTARGNRRESIFFEDGDQEICRDLLSEERGKAEVEVGACCLMPNHVNLIAFPKTPDGLSVALGAAHRRWANFIAPGRKPATTADHQPALLQAPGSWGMVLLSPYSFYRNARAVAAAWARGSSAMSAIITAGKAKRAVA